MEENQEQQLIQVYIPPNVNENFNLGNFSVDPRRMVEGAIGSFFGGYLSYKGMAYLEKWYFDIDYSTIAAIVVIIALICGAIAFLGANDEPFSNWVLHFISFKNHRRIAYYNPRVKEEAKSPLFQTNENREMIPREILNQFIEKYKHNATIKNAQHIASTEKMYLESGAAMFFEDDVGIVEKPEEYMTSADKKQKKKYAKKQRKKTKIRTTKIVKKHISSSKSNRIRKEEQKWQKRN